MAKKSRSPRTIKFDCVPFEQSGQTLVMFSAGAKKLWSVTEVNQRTEEGETGYQRAVSPAREKKIADFIDDGNVIPNSVLISFQHAKLSRDKTTLTVDNRQDAGWIIDGQHRLAGGRASKCDIILPVVAFIGLKLEEQINFFVTINKEQRGVSSSLYLELLKNIPGSKTAVENARIRTVDIAHLLRQDDASPFFGRIISTTSPRRGEISMTNFVRKVSPMCKAGGRLESFSDEERCKIINNYYLALGHTFPEEFEDTSDSVFFKTIGFGALMGVLPTILDLALSQRNGFKVSDASHILKQIADFDFGPWKSATGSGAEVAFSNALRTDLMDIATGSKTGQINL